MSKQNYLEEWGNSINDLNRLLSLLEQDQENMARCLRGELLEDYRCSTDKAMEEVRNIRRKLLRMDMAWATND